MSVEAWALTVAGQAVELNCSTTTCLALLRTRFLFDMDKTIVQAWTLSIVVS